MSGLFRPISPRPLPKLVTIRIFSSHAWKYGDHRTGLHDLLQNEWIKGVDYTDSSIPASHPEDVDADVELMQILKSRIRACDVFLVFASMYADRPWIRDEVTLAEAYDKPILAVRRNGQERLSKWATRFAHEIVSWRGDSLRSAIVRHLPDHKQSAFEQQLIRRRLGRRPTMLTDGLSIQRKQQNAFRRF